MDTRRCSKCRTVKTLGSFSRRGTRYKSWCKDCIRLFSPRKDPIKERERGAKYRQTERGRQASIERKRRWRADPVNKEKELEKKRARRKERCQNDPCFLMVQTLRNRMGRFIKGHRKESSTIGLLGCSLQEFKEIIESKFLPGMSWENHGAAGWHLDHIVPVSWFDLTNKEQQRVAFRWDNFQPLWAKDNLKKSNKFSEEI